MARPRKQNLDYFPMDVDFMDHECIVALVGKYGAIVYAIVLALTTAIFQKGYFLDWNELVKYKLLNKLQGVSEELLDECIEFLCMWNYFDSELYGVGVLTSKDIQKKYFTATKRWVRKDNLPYLLVDVPGIDSSEPVFKLPELPFPNDNAVAKQEGNNDGTADSTHATTQETAQGQVGAVREVMPNGFVVPSSEDLMVMNQTPQLQIYGPNKEDIRAFLDYWGARGWLIHGQPMYDWRAAYRSWLSKKKKFGDRIDIPSKLVQEVNQERQAISEPKPYRPEGKFEPVPTDHLKAMAERLFPQLAVAFQS